MQRRRIEAELAISFVSGGPAGSITSRQATPTSMPELAEGFGATLCLTVFPRAPIITTVYTHENLGGHHA
jgi:hypothetical protein